MFQAINLRLTWVLIAMMPSVAFANPHDVFGLWQSEAKDGFIRIDDCGDGTPCGILVWAEPEKMISSLDINNRDQTLRTRTLLGVPIVWGFRRKDTRWGDGKIYNPEDGKTFRASLRRQSDETLKVKGCLGPICISNRWTRVSSNKEEVTPL